MKDLSFLRHIGTNAHISGVYNCMPQKNERGCTKWVKTRQNTGMI